MGKHQAPAPEKKSVFKSGQHAHSDGKAGFQLPSFNMPDIRLPDLSKLKERISFKDLLKRSSDDTEEEPVDDLPEEEDEVKIYVSRKEKSAPRRTAAAPKEAAPAEPAPAAEPETQESAEAVDEIPDEPVRSRRQAREASAHERKLPSLPGMDLGSVRAFFERASAFGTEDDSPLKAFRQFSFSREQVFFTAGCALLFFLLWLLPTHNPVRFVLYLVPFLLLAANPLLDAVKEVLRKELPGRNLLIVIAALGFLCLGRIHIAVFILLIHRVFILLECYLFEKRASMLDELKKLLPDTAVAETEEGLNRQSVRDFAADDILFVPAGEVVALDGVVIEGISTLDASDLCGSGETLDVGVESRVFAGCRNLTNPLRIRVTHTFDDSTAARYVARAEKALQSEPSRAGLLQRIISYVPLGLAALGVLLALVVSIVTGSWGTWLGRGFLLIALAGCGDMLLSARTAYSTGIFDALKDGISYQNADVVDRYATTDMMIFSKTGTVTGGKYTVAGVYPVDYTEKDLLTIAALAECQSMHPIAVALRDACGIDIHHRNDITLLEEEQGRGIHTLFGGRNVYVGNSALLIDHNIVFDVPSHKGTVIHVAVDNKYAGCIVLNDKIRDGAFEGIEELRLRGVRATVMLTGDVRTMARPVASSLNFDMVKCELSNANKQEALDYLRESKGNTAAIAYVSSKDEDLTLLENADVGVGFHALTQYRMLESASVLIMSQKFLQIPQSLHSAKKIAFAALLSACIMLGLELLMVILGLAGVVSVWFAMLMLLLGRIGTLVYAIYFR